MSWRPLRRYSLARHFSRPFLQIDMNFRIPDTRLRRIQDFIYSTAEATLGLTRGGGHSHENLPFNVSDVNKQPQAHVFHLDRPPLRQRQHRCWVNQQQQRRTLLVASRQHLR